MISKNSILLSIKILYLCYMFFIVVENYFILSFIKYILHMYIDIAKNPLRTLGFFCKKIGISRLGQKKRSSYKKKECKPMTHLKSIFSPTPENPPRAFRESTFLLLSSPLLSSPQKPALPVKMPERSMLAEFLPNPTARWDSFQLFIGLHGSDEESKSRIIGA